MMIAHIFGEITSPPREPKASEPKNKVNVMSSVRMAAVIGAVVGAVIAIMFGIPYWSYDGDGAEPPEFLATSYCDILRANYNNLCPFNASGTILIIFVLAVVGASIFAGICFLFGALSGESAPPRIEQQKEMYRELEREKELERLEREIKERVERVKELEREKELERKIEEKIEGRIAQLLSGERETEEKGEKNG